MTTTKTQGDWDEPTLAGRVVTILAIAVPLGGFLVAAAYSWGVAFDWVHLAVMFGMYVATGLGVTIGYHRLFTHRSFKAPAAVRVALGVLGSMALQGPLLHWAANHRAHHKHSDTEYDPHSPNTHGGGALGALRGFWHSHMGWLFAGTCYSGETRHVPDLEKDAAAAWVSRLFLVWVGLGLLIPAVLGGVLTMSWMGVLLGLLWGGLARIFMVHHITWSVNSICHIWGWRPFRSHDGSRNNPVFGILALGEGWHNNHHAFPASARHGLMWWQFDISYVVIRVMAMMGLASEVRVVSEERMEEKRVGAREPAGVAAGA